MPQPRPLNFAILGAGHIAGKMAATLAFLRREGTVPDDEALLRPLLENVCYKNAKGMVS